MKTAPRKSPIGELNGKYAALLKVFLVTWPFVGTALLGWGAWVTISVADFAAFIEYGSRFSAGDAAALEERCEAHSDRNMATHVRDLHR